MIVPVLAVGGQSPASQSLYDLDHGRIAYTTAPVSDPISRIQARIDSGDLKLKFDSEHGYLPALLEELAKTPGTVARKLTPESAASLDMPKQSLNEGAFRWMLNENQMATEKLSDGIRSFAADSVKLEKIIAKKLAEL